MPSNNSALVALTESEDEGDLQRSPGIAMVASKCSVGTNPTNLNDAWSCEDWPQWDMSIQRELDQHANLWTWDLVEPPSNVNIVGSRLVFHYKHDTSGNIVVCKTRLVVQGFSQAEDIDYNETFSPTAKLSAI